MYCKRRHTTHCTYSICSAFVLLVTVEKVFTSKLTKVDGIDFWMILHNCLPVIVSHMKRFTIIGVAKTKPNHSMVQTQIQYNVELGAAKSTILQATDGEKYSFLSQEHSSTILRIGSVCRKVFF